ncbi:MAG: hypothetical protein WBL63_00345 [Candidatus Acidiferrum sp.]
MSHTTILRSLALLIVAVFFSSIRLAAQDAPSVAEAARRSRQQKQTSTKPAHVVDNDTLPPSKTAPDSASPSLVPAAPPASDSAAQPGEANASSAADNEGEKKAQIETLKQQIAERQQSADLLQRELALEQDNFYNKPDHERDKSGKAKLDSMQTDLKQQQADLAELKAKLADIAPQADTKPSEPPKQ